MPYLEIKPEGMHMVELIVLTWVYVATRKREEKKTSDAPDVDFGSSVNLGGGAATTG